MFDLNGNCVMIGLRSYDNCYVVCQDSLPSSSSHFCSRSNVSLIHVMWLLMTKAQIIE